MKKQHWTTEDIKFIYDHAGWVTVGPIKIRTCIAKLHYPDWGWGVGLREEPYWVPEYRNRQALLVFTYKGWRVGIAPDGKDWYHCYELSSGAPCAGGRTIQAAFIQLKDRVDHQTEKGDWILFRYRIQFQREHHDHQLLSLPLLALWI